MTTPPLVLDDAAVATALRTINVRSELATMFAALANERAIQPPQTLTLFPDGTGDFITYLGALADRAVFGTKLSPYLPYGTGALVTAWTLLMSMETGEPLLLCDAKRLTTERTAGTTALAVDLLAAPDAQSLTVIGTGPIGLAHLRHVEPVRGWTKVTLCSPSAAGKLNLPGMLESGCPVIVGTDPADAVAGADVVLLCTSSSAPVIDINKTKADALITSISTNAVDAHEIDPSMLAGMDVYCDYALTAPLSAGEMKLAIARGIWSAGALRGDLPDLTVGRAPRPTVGRRSFFRSIGLGLEDVALADAVRRAIVEEAKS
ncbi:MAG: ornithine cyclodeaminase family protein [Pseudomonadota bacterium]|jgi:L-arginine dehydrogenase